MKRKIRMTIAGLAATGLAILGTTSASAAPLRGFLIKDVAFGKCLQFNGLGHQVTAEKCDDEVTQQRWAYSPDGVISEAAGSPGYAPCLLAENGGGGYVYVNTCHFDGWSTFDANSYHDKEKAVYVSQGAGCFLKVSGGDATCTEGHDGREWWMAIYG